MSFLRAFGLSLSLVILVHGEPVAAAPGADGCFHLFLESASAPVFCLMGTAEEGIGGAGARLGFFHVNTSTPSQCFLTSGLSQVGNALFIEVGGSSEMTIVFDNDRDASDLRHGKASIGKSVYWFNELGPSATLRFQKRLVESGLCERQQAGGSSGIYLQFQMPSV